MTTYRYPPLLSKILFICSLIICIEIVDAQELSYVREGNADRLIIFIHGFTGDATDTWKNKRTKLYWPQIVAEDESFNKSDIAVYDYPTQLTGDSGLSIGDIADTLAHLLDQNIFKNYESILFISHSMGGLVTRNLLLKNDSLSQRVKGLYFLATPSGGSNLADIGNWLSLNNPQIRGMRELENNDFLSDQTSQWQQSSLSTSILTLCAHEKLEYKGVLVVDQASAQLLCNNRPVPVAENHVNIVKPKNSSSLVHISLRTLYQQIFEIKLFDPELSGEISLGSQSSSITNSLVRAKNVTLTGNTNIGDNSAVFAEHIDLNGYTLTANGGLIVAGSISNGHIQSTNSSAPASKLVVAALNMSSVKFIGNGLGGSNGINGQDGQNGRAGGNGRNGVCDGFGRYKGAHPGGDGTPGGNGTDGTNGEDGSPGGDIYVVTMNERGSFQTDVTGGRGGFGGRGGRGGNGGVGGRGGSGCVGLGGSQTGESSGRAGANGRNGRDGNPGNNGTDGKIFYKQIESVQALATELPSSDELKDYLPVIKPGLIKLATQ